MNRFRYILSLIILLVMVTGVLSFGEDPDKLIFVNVPGAADESEQEHFMPIIDYISEYVGIPIEYMVVLDYAAVLQAMQFGHADMARVGPFAAVQAKELFAPDILVRDIKANTGEPFYYSLILVHEDSEIETVCDFCRRSSELDLGYVDPTSASGFLVPKTILMKLGFADEDFNEIFFAGSHGSVNIAFGSNVIDVCCTNEFRYIKALDTGVYKEEDVRILLRSDPISTDPVIVRAGLSEDLKERLREAWLSVPPEATEAFKLLGFAPAHWEDYEPIEEIAEALGL